MADFIPFGSLFPHADVFVTNGGHGSAMLALAHGATDGASCAGPLRECGAERTGRRSSDAGGLAVEGVGAGLGLVVDVYGFSTLHLASAILILLVIGLYLPVAAPRRAVGNTRRS